MKFWRYTTKDDDLKLGSVELADVDREFVSMLHGCDIEGLDAVLDEIGLEFDDETQALRHRGVCCCDSAEWLFDYIQVAGLEVKNQVIVIFEGDYAESDISDGVVAVAKNIVEVVSVKDFMAER